MSHLVNSPPDSCDPTVAAKEEIVEHIVEPIVESDAQTITRLANLSAVEYDRERKPAAKTLGIQVKTLDELVRAAKKSGNEKIRTPFADPVPHPDPIDPASLLDDIAQELRRHVVIDQDQAWAAALWIAHTYLIDVIDISPLAIINAPERACAKTLFQTLLGTFAYRPLPAANATVSALFRAVELWRPTILIDEADTFFGNNSDLHGLVNSGYKRGGYVMRSEPTPDGSFAPTMFSVYCAKSIAGIALEKHLPDSTMSRGIVFGLRRKLSGEQVERWRNADTKTHDAIRSKLTRFALDYATAVSDARPALPDALSDRGQDNWEALFAIAACAGPEWLQRAEQAALKMSKSAESLVSTGNELLSDIKVAFEKMGVTRLCTADLLELLTEDAEKCWATYDKGRPMTPRQLAQLLKPYNVEPKTVRLGPAQTPKGYELSQFADAFARYLSPTV